MPRLVNIRWTKCEESEVWKALERCTCTPVNPETIPLPILRDLQTDVRPNANLRYFQVTGFIPGQDSKDDNEAALRRYVAIPEDTTQHETHLTDPSWNLYIPQWQAFREMPAEQIDAHIKSLLIGHLRQCHSAIGVGSNGLTRLYFPHGGIPGIDLVQEVFDETAMLYELAAERTGRTLYEMLIHNQVRRTIDENTEDRWILTVQDELLDFINAHELSQDEDEVSAMYCFRERKYRLIDWESPGLHYFHL